MFQEQILPHRVCILRDGDRSGSKCLLNGLHVYLREIEVNACWQF